MTYFDYFNIIFGVSVLFILYKYIESFWSYKISKPHKWEESVKAKTISKNLKSIEFKYRDKVRFYTMWFQIERIKKEKIDGDFAELGVHKGESANAIHEMDTSRRLHLFDTFDGFRKEDLNHEKQKDDKFSTEMFSDTSLDQVKEFINGGDKIIFHPGFFPETTKGLDDEKFAFVNIDADLYAPTIAALNYFYPKLSPGGVIMVHDYNHNWDGIQKAFDEFMPTIPEGLIELPDWQGSVMIVKNKGVN